MTLDVTELGLRDLTSCGGCAAKADSSLLHLLRSAAEGAANPNTLIGLSAPDDASVLSLNESTALITTVDFFPPIVRNPFDYGYISALNALSDVFAMGGTARAALLICGFPESMSQSDMIACVEGAKAACAQSDTEIVGGHTVRVAEAVFGLSVIGYVHPEKIWRKSGMQPGDVLMLSKPLGTGVLIAARSPEIEDIAIKTLQISNLAARNTLAELPEGVHAVTDVTGFGLAGHLSEMISDSNVEVNILLNRESVIPEALDRINNGYRTSADQRNRTAFELQVSGLLGEQSEAILFDPQTNGGLLASVSASHQNYLELNGFTTVGTVTQGHGTINFTSNIN